MRLAVFDTSVLVNLAHGDRFGALARLSSDRVVTDIVDGELLSGRSRHPVDVERYDAAKSGGLLRVEEIVVGSAAYGEYLRLRARRVNPVRNRGEDSCIALALTVPESVVFVDDQHAAKRAREELGAAERVRHSAEL